MPILEQGYEPYTGTVRRGNLRFVAVAKAAILRNRRWWLWVLLVISLLFGSAKEYFLVFIVYVPTAFFGVDPKNINNFFHALAEHPRFYTDMMSTQSFWALLMGVAVGGGEIAEDLRSGALAFYLGRPVTRLDYVAGKTAAVSFVVFLVTFVPLFLLFVTQALFEGEWRWLSDYWRVLPAALGFTLVLCFFVSGVVLGMSAIARRRLWATVGIAGSLLALTVTTWVLAPPNTWTSHSEGRQLERQMEAAKTREERKAAWEKFSDTLDDLGSGSDTAGWKVLSPIASLSAAARDLFGNKVPANFSGGRHWFLVLGVPLLLFVLLWRRVRAVEVVT
jgi:ABC-type transport system involved in multi-copper enzyme maturation permease subunit